MQYVTYLANVQLLLVTCQVETIQHFHIHSLELYPKMENLTKKLTYKN